MITRNSIRSYYWPLVAEKKIKTELESHDSIADAVKEALTEIDIRRR